MDFEALMSKVTESTGAGRAFGPPIEKGDVMIIPVTLIVGGGGAGIGHPSEHHDESATTRGEGKGGGVGHLSWPIGAYVVRNGNVRWMPAVDATIVAVAAIGLLKRIVKLRHRRAARG
ncbi:MAG: hypothetical protein QOG30_1355 [Acidimicrobiaceae bacterium]